MASRLRYLLVLDFEASCGESGFPRDQMEIIEFPTIVYDLQEKKEVGRFHEYVKPVIRPQLTEFCTKLTGITQVSSFRVSRLSFQVTYLYCTDRKRSTILNLSRPSGIASRPSCRIKACGMTPRHTPSLPAEHGTFTQCFPYNSLRSPPRTPRPNPTTASSLPTSKSGLSTLRRPSDRNTNTSMRGGWRRCSGR